MSSQRGGLPGPYQVKGVAYLVQVKSKGWPTWSTSSQRGGLPGPSQVKGVAYLVHIKSKGWPTWSISSERGGLPGPRQVKGVAYLVYVPQLTVQVLHHVSQQLRQILHLYRQLQQAAQQQLAGGHIICTAIRTMHLP